MQSFLKLSFFAITFTICGASASLASKDKYDCGDRAGAIIEHVYPMARAVEDGYKLGNVSIHLPNGGDDKAVVCRVWPGHPQFTLAAVPLIRSDHDGRSDGDIELFVLDTGNLAIEARQIQRGLSSDNFLRIEHIGIDTGNYKLAPDRLAFGLRIQRDYESPIMPMVVESLWLFEVVNHDIRTRLDGLESYRARAFIGFGGCGDENKNKDAALSMLKPSHHGYHDIDVLVSESRAWLTENGDHCSNQTSETAKHYPLEFDGDQYQLPAVLKAMH